jgi:hypothetical protein
MEEGPGFYRDVVLERAHALGVQVIHPHVADTADHGEPPGGRARTSLWWSPTRAPSESINV